MRINGLMGLGLGCLMRFQVYTGGNTDLGKIKEEDCEPLLSRPWRSGGVGWLSQGEEVAAV